MESTERRSTRYDLAAFAQRAIDKKSLALSIGITLLSSPIIFLFFDCGVSERILIAKLVQLILLYCLFHYLFALVKQAKATESARRILFCFTLILAIETLYLLAIYPGGWRWDDIAVLSEVVPNGLWSTWQGYLTALYYMVCFLTVPVPSFICFMQGLFISMIMTYMIWRVSCTSSLRWPLILTVGALIMVLPPVLNMNSYPLRAALHSYLEILAFFMLVDHYINKVDWNAKSVVFFSLISALVCIWRLECIVFALLLPLLFLFLTAYQSGRLKIFALYALCLFGSLIIIGFPQYTANNNSYAVISYSQSLPIYAHQAIEESNSELLSKLNVTYDVDVLNQAYEEGVPGEFLYALSDSEWPFLREREDMSKEQYYKACRDAFVAGTIEYPYLFLKDKIKLVLDGLMNPIRNAPCYTNAVYSSEGKLFDTFKSQYMLNDPISLRIRNDVTGFVEAVPPQFIGVQWTYNLLLLIPIYLGAYIYLIVRKSRCFFALLAFNLHHALIVLSAPAYYFMYYYSFYLGGILLLAFFLCQLAQRLFNRANVRMRADGQVRDAQHS